MVKKLESLFFFPDRVNYGGHPQKNGFDFETIKIQAKDNVTLDGWYVKSAISNPKATFVHFHGNACNITNHWDFVSWLPDLGYDLVTFDYRGFGNSSGKPDFQGVFDDCCCVLDFVKNSNLLRQSKKIILGQSIGGAFATCALADRCDKDIVGVIIDSSFNSFRDIAVSKLTFFPSIISRLITKMLLDNQFEPQECVKKIDVPKMFIHSVQDRVVSFDLGLKLYESAIAPKELIELYDPNHLSFFWQRSGHNWQKLLSFLDRVTY